MVLIRLAYAAELPAAEELAKLVQQAAPAGRVVPLAVRDLHRGSGSEAVADPRTALAPAQQPVMPQSGPPETRAFSSFKDLIALAADKRDIRLKSDLENLVRPIRVAPGRLEIALEPQAQPGLANDIARKLEAFTGMRWMVMVARDGGEKSIARQRQENRDSLFVSARAHPDVQAVLARFPGAEIVDVREPEQAILPSPAMSESDEEPR
jgi:DNA polymerase-3 subunit gamma/tau